VAAVKPVAAVAAPVARAADQVAPKAVEQPVVKVAAVVERVKTVVPSAPAAKSSPDAPQGPAAASSVALSSPAAAHRPADSSVAQSSGAAPTETVASSTDEQAAAAVRTVRAHAPVAVGTSIGRELVRSVVFVSGGSVAAAVRPTPSVPSVVVETMEGALARMASGEGDPVPAPASPPSRFDVVVAGLSAAAGAAGASGFGLLAVLAAGLLLVAPVLSRWLRLARETVRPFRYVLLLERPG
jgi:hypothetical protein